MSSDDGEPPPPKVDLLPCILTAAKQQIRQALKRSAFYDVGGLCHHLAIDEEYYNYQVESGITTEYRKYGNNFCNARTWTIDLWGPGQRDVDENEDLSIDLEELAKVVLISSLGFLDPIIEEQLAQPNTRLAIVIR